MPPPIRSKTPTGIEGLEWLLTDDGSRTLFASDLNETYHSGCGAVAESCVVYLQNSRVWERLRSGQPTSVLEYGFGTATAFLLTAAAAEMHSAQLIYTGLELQLLSAELLAQLPLAQSQLPAEFSDSQGLLAAAESLKSKLSEQMRSALTSALPTHVSLPLSDFVTLELCLGDARTFHSSRLYDAVYFDPFSPQTSPELWTEAVFKTAYDSLRSSGTLTSYCVKSSVRNLLQSTGFEVHKVAGPIGGKREVLLAIKP